MTEHKKTDYFNDRMTVNYRVTLVTGLWDIKRETLSEGGLVLMIFTWKNLVSYLKFQTTS